MPFGYIKDGQPVEIVSEAVIDDVAHSLGTLMLWTDEERAAIGVMPILPPDPAPEGQRLAGTTLAIVDGQLKHVGVYEDVPPPAVPAKVHKYWLTKVLEGLGEMDAIEDAMDDMAAAGNRTPRRDWQNATEVERANQLVNEFATLRGYTAEQVDQMFIQAAAYQAAAS